MSAAPVIIPLAEFARQTEADLDPTVPAAGYASQFGAVRYRDRNAPHDRRHEYLIKNVLTRGEQAMLVGASQSGKSFLALDMCMSVARGVPWFGHKAKQGLVVYHAGESAKGLRDKRIPAYDRANELAADADLPFVLLTLPLDLYSSDEDTDKLVAECRYWQTEYPDTPLELLVIDTFSSATPGADENSGKDVGAIRARCKRLETTLNCTVLLVHHKNAAGTKHRGHTSMFADVENVLDVSLVTRLEGKEPVPVKDIRGRKVREFQLTKVKDGEDGRKYRFTLALVRLGEDEDGEPLTSCVIDAPDMGDVEPSEHEKAAKGEARLPQQQYLLLKAIEEAVRVHGRCPAPAGVPVAKDVLVVEWRHPRDLFAARWFLEEADAEKRATALKGVMQKAGNALCARGYIQRHDNWVWRTSKPLPGERNRRRYEGGPDPDPNTETEADAAPEAGDASNSDWLGEE